MLVFRCSERVIRRHAVAQGVEHKYVLYELIRRQCVVFGSAWCQVDLTESHLGLQGLVLYPREPESQVYDEQRRRPADVNG